MIYNLFGFDFFLELEILQLVIFCSILGNIFRLILSFFHNQQWTRTRLQFLNFSFLPAITFIITKIISGNIALSLGMVGALSIVRLRTPVKNPFELIAYFFLITLGIVTSVNPNIAINFLIITFLISLLIELINNLISKSSSGGGKYISDLESKATLVITLNKKIDIIERSNFLKNISFDQDSYKYTLLSSDINELTKIVSSIDDTDIVSYFIENVSEV
tara:strand:+ start:56 stop:712 length:657 start_codon:yes stop_codon:yes gene_type:complete